MSRRMLPPHLQDRLRRATRYIQDFVPGAGQVHYLDTVHDSPLRWHLMQFTAPNGQRGVIQIRDNVRGTTDDRETLSYEFYTPVLGHRNDCT